MQHFSSCKAAKAPTPFCLVFNSERSFVGQQRKGGAEEHKVALILDLAVCLKRERESE